MIQHSTIKYGHLLVGHSLSFDGQDELVNKCQLHNFTLSNLIRTKPMYEQEFKANYIAHITNKMQTKWSPFPLSWHRLKPCEPSANLAPVAWIKRPMSCDKAIWWPVPRSLDCYLQGQIDVLCPLYCCELWYVYKTIYLEMYIYYMYIIYIDNISFKIFQTWYLAPIWMWNKWICCDVIHNAWSAPQFRLFVVIQDAKLEITVEQQSNTLLHYFSTHYSLLIYTTFSSNNTHWISLISVPSKSQQC